MKVLIVGIKQKVNKFFTQNFLGNFKYNLSSFQIREIFTFYRSPVFLLTGLILGCRGGPDQNINSIFCLSNSNHDINENTGSNVLSLITGFTST